MPITRIDFKRSKGLVELETGRWLLKSLPLVWARQSEFDFAELDPEQNRIKFGHPSGTVIHAELEPIGRTLTPSLPVLYLDQCHWITLARQIWAPEKVLEREQSAAIELIELARDGRVILPLSSANLTEMTPADGRFRRHLSLTMLQLSRGWQMRNPVHVRGAELRAFFSEEAPLASGVFTLAPNSLFIGNEPLAPPIARDPISGYAERLREIHALYETAVENQKLPNDEGLKKAEAWAREQRRFSLLLHQDKVGQSDAEHYSAARLVWDLASEVLAAARNVGVQESEIQEWLSGPIEDDINKMPYLGAYHRTVFDRVKNPHAKWEANHFNDIQFLSCGVAYADVVVGEKETSEHLRRAQRSRAGATICRTLPEALASLNDREKRGD